MLLNGEGLKTFSLRLETRQRYVHSLLLFNSVTDILANSIRQEKEIKCTKTSNKVGKPLFFADNIILHTENLSQKSMRKIEIINSTK